MAEISLDIETLSTHKNAVVASIGACRVTKDGLVEHTDSDFYVRLDAQEQIDAGRHVSMDTLRFWMAQEQSTRADTFQGPALSVMKAIKELRRWIDREDDGDIWTKGPTFDDAILESLAEQFYCRPAWHFRRHRDIRTLDTIIEWVGDDATRNGWYAAQEMFSAGNDAVNNALEDAKAQGRLLAWFMEECTK